MLATAAQAPAVVAVTDTTVIAAKPFPWWLLILIGMAVYVISSGKGR